MRKALAILRRNAQLVVHSRLGLRRPTLLANSIPKSGTHLVKAILTGAGYSFVGHYGETEHALVRMSDSNTLNFATAHMTKPIVGPGRRLLVYRDPVDVAISMAVYFRNRTDHPRHTAVSGLSLEDAADAVFAGFDDLDALALRYNRLWDWAKASDALTIDYADVQEDPASLLRLISYDGYDAAQISASVGRWNPTKRDRKEPNEQVLKTVLRSSKSQPVQDAIAIYQEIRAAGHSTSPPNT